MSKEFEKLKSITRNKLEYIKRQPKIDWVHLEYYEGVLDLVTRLEAIEKAKAKPSEALEILEVLDKTISPLLEPVLAEYEDDLSDKITANYFALKQSLLKAQEQDFNYKNIVIPFFDELVELLATNDIDDMLDKIKEQHNVLRILKEKRVDGQLIRIADNVKWYNNNYIYRHEIEYLNRDDVLVYQLTEEEFDTVKRWMSDDKSN